MKEIGAGAVFWNRPYEPYAIARDKALKEKLTKARIEVATCNGALLFEPWTVKTKTGDPFKVFAPFWRACQQLPRRSMHGVAQVRANAAISVLRRSAWVTNRPCGASS